MLKLQGKNIYLSTLERSDCSKLYKDFEYDFNQITDRLHIGYSNEGANDWFEEIQKLQGKQHIRLGIYTLDGEVIGDIALQDIDQWNRTCSIGLGIAKLENRHKGYGSEALELIIDYAINNVGLEKITGSTLEINIAMQKAFEKLGFILEGCQREAIYFGGRRYGNLNYGLLAHEWLKKGEKNG